MQVRTLYLLRHAKSSWGDPSLTDFDRPLNRRGRQGVKMLARHWTAQALDPQLVLCSTATRTRQTLTGIVERIPNPPPVAMIAGLYLAEPEAILALIADQLASVERLMVIAHNPGIELLANDLIGRGDPGLRETLAAKVPTGALIEIGFQSEDWADIHPGSGELASFTTPKRLSGEEEDADD